MLLSFHSYKGGTGKTNLVGNMGVYLAKKGMKVCIIDTDLNGPGIHSLFNLEFENSLIEFLKNECEIRDIVYKPRTELELYIIPARVFEEDITSFSKTPSQAKEKLLGLVDYMNVEYGVEHILFDCSPGINKSSLLTMNLADKATIVSTIDRQDIRGTYIITSMAKELGAHTYLLFNQIPRDNEMEDLLEEFCKKLDVELLGTITYDKDMADTWSRRLVMDGDRKCGYCGQVHKIVERLVG